MKVIDLLRYYNEEETVLIRYTNNEDFERYCFEGNFYDIREQKEFLLMEEIKYFSIHQNGNYIRLNIVLNDLHNRECCRYKIYCIS